MARDETFKRYEEAGAEFIESARSRAVEFLKELSQLGETTQRHAQGQVGELVDIGRARSDQVIDVVRAEISHQLGQLGLATRADLAALERRVTGSTPAVRSAKRSGATKAPTKKVATATQGASTKAAATKAAATKVAAKKASATKAAAKKSAAAKAPVKKAGTTGKTGTAKKSAPTKVAGATAKR